MIAERMRLNTQKLIAIRLPSPALSNVWWPLALHVEDADNEKVLALCTRTLLLWVGNQPLIPLLELAHEAPEPIDLAIGRFKRTPARTEGQPTRPTTKEREPGHTQQQAGPKSNARPKKPRLQHRNAHAN